MTSQWVITPDGDIAIKRCHGHRTNIVCHRVCKQAVFAVCVCLCEREREQ